MARSITYNGITRFKPGGITKINADALNQVSALPNSVVAIIGEADGGAPGLHSMSSPADALTLFKSGPGVDAIRQAFQSSGDSRVPGGASQVLFYKTNQSTQATSALPSAEAVASVDSAATGGSTTTIVDSALTGTVDDQFNGYTLVLRPFTATAEARVVTDYVASTGTFTVATLSAAAVATNDYLVFPAQVDLLAVTIAGSTSTVLNLGSSVVDDEHNGKWAHIQVGAISYLRKIVDTDGTAETLTVTPALPAAVAIGSVVQVLPNSITLTSRDYGVHTNGLTIDVGPGTLRGKVVSVQFEGATIQSPDLGGLPVATLLYRGGAALISDTVAAGATTTVIPLTTGGLVASAHVGRQVQIGFTYTRITANAVGSITVSPALPFAPAATAAVRIIGVTGASLAVSGSSSATGLSVAVTGVSGDNLAVTFSAGMTLRQLQTVVNANPNYLLSVYPGVNPDTTLAASFDIVSGVQCLASSSVATEGLTRDLLAVVDYLNNFSALVSASRASTGGLFAGSFVPAETADPITFSGGSRGISANSNFQAGFDALLEVRANSVIPLIDEDLVNEGFGSTATWSSVAAQLADHVTIARGAAQHPAGERGGFIGKRGTLAQIISAANSINDMDVQLVPTHVTALAASGSLVEFGPRMGAIIAASMRAGVSSIGEPLTHKYLRVNGISQDASWSPSNNTAANALIVAGVLFAEAVPGKGVRWVRDITTHVQDDNLCFTEGSVRDAVRFVAFGLRDALVSRFTGNKATPVKISSVKDLAATQLEVYRSDEVIVDSTDPNTGNLVNAWHNLKVTSSGDTVTVTVGIFPVPGINFILNSIHLQIATQSA